MDEHVVHIEGDLEENERERLLRLIRRVEAAGTFKPVPEEWGAAWIVVVGWGSDDTGPVSMTRLRCSLTFAAPDVDGVVRKMERWLDENKGGA